MGELYLVLQCFKEPAVEPRMILSGENFQERPEDFDHVRKLLPGGELTVLYVDLDFGDGIVENAWRCKEHTWEELSPFEISAIDARFIKW